MSSPSLVSAFLPHPRRTGGQFVLRPTLTRRHRSPRRTGQARRQHADPAISPFHIVRTARKLFVTLTPPITTSARAIRRHDKRSPHRQKTRRLTRRGTRRTHDDRDEDEESHRGTQGDGPG